MAQKVGLIQSRGIGDIIIALPIAQDFLDRGFEVFWPIDQALLDIFQPAEPAVHFIGVARGKGFNFEEPKRALVERGCERIICLLNYLEGHYVHDERLSRSLKFDEYKYAIAGVRFGRKWELRLVRNRERAALMQRLNISTDKYIVTHTVGSNWRV